ncbi:hypothetical protein AQUCO_01600226v1 [Aquilegia coerulea]|uniref:Protein POLAR LOCALIZATION DURING ASYMMETRIC DIVISION AND REDISTRIBUTION n=1 Tax=Aquilegia coerulea TaxID=218851 RepID=A0A2G5DQP5_AQUCA|nr:hypothetical protein AQUCO_01600226v1 [Aquilegia coerulea]
MRIADVLMKGVDGDEKNDDGDGDVSSSRKQQSFLRCWLFTCSTSSSSSSSKRSITLPFSKVKEKKENEIQRIRRNEFAKKSFGSLKVVDDEEEEMKRKSKPLVLMKSKSTNDMVDSSCSSYSGKHTKDQDVSFTLGLGAGIAIFTAASKNEFEKMKELRSEVETLIKEVKDEIQRNNATFEASDSRDILISSTASFDDVHGMNHHSTIVNCTQSHLLEQTKTTMECDSDINCDTSRKEDWIPGTEQLEAEVEAELERLQLRLDAEEFSEQQQWSENVMNNGLEESVSESPGEVEVPDGGEQEDGVCPNELKRRLQVLLEERQQDQIDWLDFAIEFSGSGEVDNHQEANGGELSYGVSPNILERRLHELLEARQQERIKELEYALERVNQKLRQKEMEVSWWKDIAKLTSQNDSDAIHLPR